MHTDRNTAKQHSPRNVKEPELECSSDSVGARQDVFLQQAKTIRKNGFIVLNGRPCKVVETRASKGYITFVGENIFSGERHTETIPYSHDCEVPVVSYEEYVLMDITDDGDDDDGFVTLLSDNSVLRDDMQLPTGTPEYDSIAMDLRRYHSSSEPGDIVVVVLRAMGDEVIHSFRMCKDDKKC